MIRAPISTSEAVLKQKMSVIGGVSPAMVSNTITSPREKLHRPFGGFSKSGDIIPIYNSSKGFVDYITTDTLLRQRGILYRKDARNAEKGICGRNGFPPARE